MVHVQAQQAAHGALVLQNADDEQPVQHGDPVPLYGALQALGHTFGCVGPHAGSPAGWIVVGFIAHIFSPAVLGERHADGIHVQKALRAEGCLAQSINLSCFYCSRKPPPILFAKFTSIFSFFRKIHKVSSKRCMRNVRSRRAIPPWLSGPRPSWRPFPAPEGMPT